MLAPSGRSNVDFDAASPFDVIELQLRIVKVGTSMCVPESRIEHQYFFSGAATQILLIKILKLPNIVEERLVHDERGLYIDDEVTNSG
jgi:hypothetical protein